MLKTSAPRQLTGTLLAATMTCALTAVSALADAPKAISPEPLQFEAKQVTVLGRQWQVRPSKKHPGYAKATRLNPNSVPYLPPAMIGTRQAIRAYSAATGCSAQIDSMFKSIDGDYFTRLICN